jgi:Cys-tRNA(Pro) deacylase
VLSHADVSALALAFWRDISTFMVLLVGLALLRPVWLRVARRDLPWLAALGGALGVFHVFWNLGVMVNGAAVATVQQAAMPAIVAVAARLVWRESLTWNKVLAIALTFVGTVLVSGVDVLGQAELSISGLLIGLGIPVTYAGWNLFGKRCREQYGPLTVLTYAFGFGALALLPFQFFIPQPWPVSPSAGLWFAGLISMATIAPFFLYTFALGRLPASVASILAMAEIPIVTVYAYILLGEQMRLDQAVGAVLVVAGVLLLSWRGWPKSGGGERMVKQKRVPKTMPMRVLEERGVPYELHVHAHNQYTATGVAEDLGIPVAQIVKAMILQRSDGGFVLAAVPGDKRLNLKKIGAALGDKGVRMAAERDVQRVTGYQVGAVSVMGFRRDDIPAYVDEHVLESEQIIISSGRPDAGLALSPEDLLRALPGAQVGDFCDS